MTHRIARALRDSGVHVLRGWHGETVRRRPDGGFEPVPPSPDGPADETA